MGNVLHLRRKCTQIVRNSGGQVARMQTASDEPRNGFTPESDHEAWKRLWESRGISLVSKSRMAVIKVEARGVRQ